MFKKIKEWFIGGSLHHPMCADCNGCDCYKFPECDHIVLNWYEYQQYEEAEKAEKIKVKDGKKYRKLDREEVIAEGAMHSWCNGELHPIMSIDTIGDKPSSFCDKRDFYNPV